MTSPLPPSTRSLQRRLALFYAAGIFAAGLVLLAIVLLPLAGLQSTAPAPGPKPDAITGTGSGIGPRQLLIAAAAGAAVLIPISSAAGWFVAGRFLRPLRAITATAKAISAGNLHRRLALGEPADELTELGHILDDLFARLEASFDAQRHFVANASHELRTPLAGLRTLLEVALADPHADADGLRAACREALALGGYQERLVGAMLDLATSERGLTRSEPVDLGEVAARVLASRRDEAAEKSVELREDLAAAVAVGDPRLVESLVANLVDNAIGHNHVGGRVEVTTGTYGGQAIVTVANSGPVVPGEEVRRLFQPFQRLSPDRHSRRGGHGLGLAIVEAVAQAHRAALSAEARPEGGLSVTVGFAPFQGEDPTARLVR